MNPAMVIFLALLLIGTMNAKIPEIQAAKPKDFEKGGIDLLCTISCAGYWLCVIKSGDCKSPENCICNEFPHGR